MKKISYLIFPALIITFILFGIFNLRVPDNDTSQKVDPHLLKKGGVALMNADYEFIKSRDPNIDAIPGNIRARELAFAKTLPVKPHGERGQDWEERGPTNVGGRMLCLGFDILDENIINAGSASGGMWRSEDGGTSWMKTTPMDAEQSATCIVQDKREGKTNTWYYGTGELLNSTNRNVSTNVRTVGVGNGIFKSVDNGVTWQALASTLVNDPAALDHVFQGIWNIVIDPVTMDKDIVYAACYGAIMRSENGGESWDIVLGDLANKSFATEIQITDQGVLYATLSSFTTSIERPDKAGIWRSEDGLNWTDITPANFPLISRVMKLAIAPSNQNIVYLIEEGPCDVLVPFNGIFNSANTFWKYTWDDVTETGTWEERTENMFGGGYGDFGRYPNSFISYGGYTLVMAVKPDDENVVLTGCMNLYRTDNGYQDSLHTHFMGGYPFDMDSLHQLHPDLHSLTFLPSNPNVLFIGCDGGVVMTEDYMVDTPIWERKNTGLISSQFYTVSVDIGATGDDFVLGGLQDNNWYYSPSDNPAEFWLSIDICYDGFASKISDNREYAVISAYSGNIWTCQFNEDMTTKNIFSQTPDTLLKYYDPVIGANPIFAFYQNFALDPVSDAIFYMPTKHSIWRKTDMRSAASDTNFRNVGWVHLENAFVSDAQQITAISVSSVPDHVLYYGTDGGNVFRMDAANSDNPVQVEITPSETTLGSFVACIDIDTKDAEKAIVVHSNYGVKSLWYTDDGGTSWISIGGNLEENPDGSGAGPAIRWVKSLHHEDQTIYFAGTSVGLFSTNELNGDETVWMREGAETIGSLLVDGIDARDSDGFVAIATQGNGVFSTYYDASAGAGNLADESVLLLNVYPNPASVEATLSYSLERSGFVKIILMDISGKLVRSIFEGEQEIGQHTVQLPTDKMADGIYMIRIAFNNHTEIVKLVKH